MKVIVILVAIGALATAPKNKTKKNDWRNEKPEEKSRQYRP